MAGYSINAKTATRPGDTWRYEIKDKNSGMVLKARPCFENSVDAREQARIDANLENIKNYYIIVCTED